MATEILMRHFGAELEGRECGQVAYDVQIRRVFLRAGLVEDDSLEEIEAARVRDLSRIARDSRPGDLADRS